jgi:CRISPR-associated protein Cst2
MSLTHVAGTFLIQARGSFLNGRGLKPGLEKETITEHKYFRDGKNTVPYVSAQAWRRWLRDTLIEETGWPKSEFKVVKFSKKGTTSQVAPEINPAEFAEDDIFGYMYARGKSAARAKPSGESEEDVEEVSNDEEGAVANQKVRSVMRASPLLSSLLVSIRAEGWRGSDPGFVFPREVDEEALKMVEKGTEPKISPLPYGTEFYNTYLQAFFCLNYARLGVFSNLGDRIELDDRFVQSDKIKIKYDMGRLGKIYEIANPSVRKERATALLKALARLRGGAKQAQFGTDIAPRVLVAAGLSCGNPIFNNLFEDRETKPVLRTDVLTEICSDYSGRIATPVLIGIRSGVLGNEEDVRKLHDEKSDNPKFIVTTPIEAADRLAAYLQ